MTAAIKINANDGVTRNVMTGGETEVDFDFPIFAATHLKVYETDAAGDITLLVKDTDYTVPAGSVGIQAGGTIDLDGTQYPSGATAGHVFTVYQAAPEARTTDFNQAGDFLADTLNQELDLITQQIQQLRRDLSRAAQIPVDSTLTGVTLPDPEDGKMLLWDGTAGAMRNGPTADNIANAQGYADDAETAQAAAEAAQAAAELAAANLPLNKLNGTAAPTVNDDTADGYSVGSKWYDLTNDEAYICLDATLGAAVWALSTLDTEDLGTAAFVNVIDEDSFATDSATRPPSQQSVKAYTYSKMQVDALFTALPTGYCHLVDSKSANTAGGGATSGSWFTRTLNTSVADTISVSLGSDQFTLPAGTYEIDASCPANQVIGHQARLYNVTDAAVALNGTTASNNSSSTANTSNSFIKGRITIAGAKTFRLEQRVNTTKASDGLGYPANIGSSEIYSQIIIRKV